MEPMAMRVTEMGKRRLPCNRGLRRLVGQDHLAGNGADFLLVLNSRTALDEPMHEPKQMTTGQPVGAVHTSLVDFHRRANRQQVSIE
jgi:hypothetical protein